MNYLVANEDAGLFAVVDDSRLSDKIVELQLRAQHKGASHTTPRVFELGREMDVKIKTIAEVSAKENR